MNKTDTPQTDPPTRSARWNIDDVEVVTWLRLRFEKNFWNSFGTPHSNCFVAEATLLCDQGVALRLWRNTSDFERENLTEVALPPDKRLVIANLLRAVAANPTQARQMLGQSTTIRHAGHGNPTIVRLTSGRASHIPQEELLLDWSSDAMMIQDGLLKAIDELLDDPNSTV